MLFCSKLGDDDGERDLRSAADFTDRDDVALSPSSSFTLSLVFTSLISGVRF
jgi:hypothetical protein